MLKNMKVGTLLLSGFLIVATLGAIVAAIGIFNMSKMNDQAGRANRDLIGISHSKEANVNLIEMGRALRGVLLASNASDVERFTGLITTAQREIREQLDPARPLYTTPNGKVVFAEVEQALAAYNTAVAHAMTLAQDSTPEGKAAATAYALGPLAAVAVKADDKFTELAEIKVKFAADAAAEASAVYEATRMTMVVLVLAALATSIGLGIWITRRLTGQLGGEPAYAVEIASAIAAGQLSVTVATRPGDASSLLYAMETMRSSLVKIVGQVRSGTDTIATASSQISSGNLDLSSRTEEQASSLEETASSMEELTSTVKQNADNAKQANVLAVTASQVAVRGGTVVSEVVDTMASINESSRKIVDIIGVIDGIAFQTNILALNAAVEAARAGEQGRGFAVVASEVRNLAQRSAAAAKEIKMLINDSVEKVDAGGRLVDQAGLTMTEIVQSITRVTDIMAEIASASAEQSVGIDQINSAISQMDEVTQQNAALVEEAAAAAGSLQEQAASLAQVVSVFKLDKQESHHAAPAMRAASVQRGVKAAPRSAGAKAGASTQRLAVANSGAQDWEEF